MLEDDFGADVVDPGGGVREGGEQQLETTGEGGLRGEHGGAGTSGPLSGCVKRRAGAGPSVHLRSRTTESSGKTRNENPIRNRSSVETKPNKSIIR